MSEKQIKSKERVTEHGEVFTADREVEAMLDLVDDETKRVESTFLEPACGEGAFLIKILQRKLKAVENQYGKSPTSYERNSILALSSLYGIDIMADNAQKCRDRLYEYWNKDYSKHCKGIVRKDVQDAAKFILDKNILVGNALTLTLVDDQQQDTDKPIIFAEWTFVTGDLLQRRDFRLDVILKAEDDFTSLKQGKKAAISYSLFDTGNEVNDYDLYETDPITNEIVPKPIKVHSPMNYWEIQKES